MKHISIKDLARELNMSPSTVSRAFNDKYDIKEETKLRVLAKAKEMGYRPNPIAKKLKQQCSMNIGVVIPEFESSFFPEVIIGIQDVLSELGYQVLIMQSNTDHETERRNVETLYDNMVDGVIISMASDSTNVEYYQELIDGGFPMVFFNRVGENLNANKVVFDDYKWSFFATEHLIYQGYKDIQVFAGRPDQSFSKNRVAGFSAAMKKHHLDIKKEIQVPNLSIKTAEKVMEEYLDNGGKCDAIFAVNDPTAVGIMKALKKRGINIPDDIGVIGFTETALGVAVEPELSTVKQPTHDMGRTVARLLLHQIKDNHRTPQSVVMEGKLKIKGSSVREKK